MEPNQQNNPAASATQNEANAPNQSAINRPFRIGVIYNGTNAEDIALYVPDFKKINEVWGAYVSLVFMGYDPADDKDNILDGVSYEYVKPVSIVHYFKQLKTNEIDLLFIPLINNTYNATSENYNKYLEAALFNIPVLTVNIFPYNRCISDQINGFLYDKKEDFFDYLRFLLGKQFDLIRHCGNSAFNEVTNKFNFSPENIALINKVISV